MKRNQKLEPNGDARLMHQVKEVLRYCRYATGTERSLNLNPELKENLARNYMQNR